MESYIHPFWYNTCRFVLAALTAAVLSGCAASGAVDEWRTYTPTANNNDETEDRHYHVFVPNDVLDNDSLVPLVVNMHGATPAPGFATTLGSSFQKFLTGMPAHAAENEYIVIHPQARNTNGRQFWITSDEVDADFINSIVTDLSEEFPIDPDRIFLMGFSSGGMMSWKLACDYGERYAAIGPVAADRRGALECPNARAMPVISFHGTDDETVAYEGGIESVVNWAEQHACQTQETFFEEADTTCERWSNCNDNAEMQFCTNEAAGHTWPAGPGSFVVSAFGFGTTSYTLNATDKIWEFFESTAINQ